MRARLISPGDLTPELKATWESHLEATALWDTPCLRPELFQAVANAFPACALLLLEDEGDTGFLPLLRPGRSAFARSIPMCDYDAIIGPPGRLWDLPAALRSAGLHAWDFDNLLASRPPGEAGAASYASPLARVSDGMRGYLAGREADGIRFRNLMAKQKRAERDLGPLRLVDAGNDPRVLDSLLAWKEGRFPDLQADRVREVLARLQGGDPDRFQGRLAALCAGDTLLAAHFGIASRGMLHYWFPAFNPDHARYSPGQLLVYHLLEGLQASGCHTLDFGPGGEAYKHIYANAQRVCLRGSLEVPGFPVRLRHWRRTLEGALRASPWVRGVLRPVVRFARRLRP